MSSPRSGSPECQPQSVVGKEGGSSAKDGAQGEAPPRPTHHGAHQSCQARTLDAPTLRHRLASDYHCDGKGFGRDFFPSGNSTHNTLRAWREQAPHARGGGAVLGTARGRSRHQEGVELLAFFVAGTGDKDILVAKSRIVGLGV